MIIVWEELRTKATETTLMGNLRSRDVACILKLRFHLTGDIDLEQVLEEMMPPEQDMTPAIESQEIQEDVFLIDGVFVKKARSYEEMNPVDTQETGFQCPVRKRIRSDSDAYEEELIKLFLQSSDSRKGSSSSLNSRTQVAEEMKNRKELFKDCSVPITYAGFRANHKHGESKEYGQRHIYTHERLSKTTGKTIRQHYEGLKPSNKKKRLENDLRTVHLNPEYNYYDPLKDKNFALMRPSNDERSVEFC